MVKIARQYKRDVGIISLARRLTDHLPEKDFTGEITALQHFVRDEIRYVRDPEGVEMVQTPPRTLEIRAGDCDDKSVLLASLLGSMGFKTLFMAVGLNGQPYSHVLVQVLLGTRKISLETIIAGIEPGWAPPDITSFMVAHV